MLEQFIRFRAQPGQQAALFECPIGDILFGGARGGGKSKGSLGHFDAHQNEYGSLVKGILFRRTYPELEDIIADAIEMFCNDDDPNKARWFETKKTLLFPNKATLKFRFLEKDKDADKYQGHSYTWICIEEAGNFPSPIPIDKLRACLRSAKAANVAKWFLLTANPGGAGHNWLKSQYIDPAPPEVPHLVERSVTVNGKPKNVSWYRVFIPSKITDNKILMENDPDYINKIVASAGGQDWLLKAWLDGDWNIVAGGMFDDIWNAEKHIIPPFVVPHHWKVYRSFDWGSSRPFSVGWWSVSDGGHVECSDGKYRIFSRGTLIRVGEYYGWNGNPNVGLRLGETDFVKNLLDREEVLKHKYKITKVFDGPADSQIFSDSEDNSIADKHERMGICWERAQKGPGSRVRAWQEIRGLLSNSLKFPMEDRGMFVTSDCTNFIRLLPSTARDKNNLDDIDSDGEDHICDETGYMARWNPTVVQPVEISGF